jgi:hypothetical protein
MSAAKKYIATSDRLAVDRDWNGNTGFSKTLVEI